MRLTFPATDARVATASAAATARVAAVVVFLIIHSSAAEVIRLVGSPSRQSGTFTPDSGSGRAVDGNNSTCSVACTECSGLESGEDRRYGWLQVDMGAVYTVEGVALISNHDVTNAQYLENFVVMIKNDNSTSDPQGDQKCHNFAENSISPGQLIRINCLKPVQGRYLTFKRAGGYRMDAFSTCEVFAWSTKVIQGQTATPTSNQVSSFISFPSNPTLENKPAASSGLSKESIIGISLGAIFGIIIIVLVIILIILCLRFSKKREADEDRLKVISHPDRESFASTGSIYKHSSVAADDLNDHVRMMRTLAGRGYKEEFMDLPEDELYDVTVASCTINQCKNRFQNVLPYNNNRVYIDGLSSDYVNASFIEGFGNKTNSYIATQDPLDVTMVDFWSMIFQHNVTRIVSLSSSVRFWPEVQETYGTVKVSMVTEERYAHYARRSFLLDANNGSMEVIQFEYIEEEFLTTPFRFLSFIGVVRNSMGGQNHVTAVHCRTGIGQTGCYIAVDFLLDELESRDQVGVAKCVEQLRHQRMNAVQTLEQYEFISDVMLEKVLIGRQVVTWPKLVEKLERLMKLKRNGNVELDARYQTLKDFVHSLIDKKRRGSCVDLDDVCLNSYKKKNGYWLKRLPIPSQFDVFWRSMLQSKTDVCVAIGSDIEKFWPTEVNVEQCYDVIGVTCKEMTSVLSDVIKSSRYEVVNYSKANDQSHNMVVIHLNYFPSFTPDDSFYKDSAASHVVDLYSLMTGDSIVSSSVAFLCQDGVTHCGLVATAFYMLDVMKVEDVADVAGACRHVASVHPRSISSATQFKFLHQILLDFLRRSPCTAGQLFVPDSDLCNSIVDFNPIGSSFV